MLLLRQRTLAPSLSLHCIWFSHEVCIDLSFESAVLHGHFVWLNCVDQTV
jgi:hypothetical protein